MGMSPAPSSNILLFEIFSLIGLFLATFAAGILITHRFLGPIHAVKRALDVFKNEKRVEKIRIRDTDELQPLVEQLNEFLASLEKT